MLDVGNLLGHITYLMTIMIRVVGMIAECFFIVVRISRISLFFRVSNEDPKVATRESFKRNLHVATRGSFKRNLQLIIVRL